MEARVRHDGSLVGRGGGPFYGSLLIEEGVTGDYFQYTVAEVTAIYFWFFPFGA